MLHIKDIEAFASINEALARKAEPAGSDEPADLDADHGASRIPRFGLDFDLVPPRPFMPFPLFQRKPHHAKR